MASISVISPGAGRVERAQRRGRQGRQDRLRTTRREIAMARLTQARRQTPDQVDRGRRQYPGRTRAGSPSGHQPAPRRDLPRADRPRHERATSRRPLGDVPVWRTRPRERVYPIVYFDTMSVKVREHRSVRSRACYRPIGMTCNGDREVLGLSGGSDRGRRASIAFGNPSTPSRQQIRTSLVPR